MGSKRGISRSAAAVLLLAAFLAAPVRSARAADDYFWKLGVGTYGSAPAGCDADTLLTHARFDWQMLAFGGQVDMPTVNRCLEMNPRQRFLVRLWPVSHSDTFLEYLYTPGVRERVDGRIAAQVREVLDAISRPKQVVAFTFLEELPSRWMPEFIWRPKAGSDYSALLQPYRQAIEKDLGRPFVCDDAGTAWLRGKYAESMEKIHTAIRAAAGADKLVIYWPRFDCFDVNAIGKIVRPGGADGVFIYVLRPDQWAAHVKAAEERGWPFFSQLSHNTAMKQADWKSCVELPHVKSRYNLGYFFYGSGNPLRPHFFDNPAVDRVNNVHRFSAPVHLRWFAADRNLGWDIFKRYVRFEPEIDFRPKGAAVGDTLLLHATVPNPILEGHYPDAADRVVSDVTATLELPGWLRIESGDRVVKLGILGPSRHRAPSPASFAVARWRLRVVGRPSPEGTVAVSIAGKHARLGTIAGRTAASAAEGRAAPAFAERPVLVSGQGWTEPGFVLERDTAPSVEIKTGSRPVAGPSLTDGEFTVNVNLGTYKNEAGFYRLLPVSPVGEGVNRLLYKGTLPADSTLTVGPDRRAFLAPTRPLLDRRTGSAAEPGPGVSGAYYLGALPVNRPIPAGEKVVVTIAGKKAGGVNSHVLAYFTCADTGAQQAAGILTNRFGEEWREVSVEVVPPFKNAILRSVALYRFPGTATGTVWYGRVAADFASAPEPPKDVSGAVEGAMPLLRAGRPTVITYYDEDTGQPEGSKLRVRFFSAPAGPPSAGEHGRVP